MWGVLQHKCVFRGWRCACSQASKFYFRPSVVIPAVNCASKRLSFPARSLSTTILGASTSNTAASLLDDLMNYERNGIPPAAGTAGSSRFDLGRMRRLLASLGNPHLGLKAVHVAGSKGKGSTVTFLAQILAEGGYRSGVYTSPHLLALEERIAVTDPAAASRHPRPLPPDDLAFLIAHHADAIRARAVAEGGALSHFEVMTALSFRYFADCSVDVAVVETGLGGVTDATNVFPPANVQAAVITGLGMEHVEALGGSLRSIAAAKAGILRPGRPVILSRQVYDEAADIVLAEAAALGCEPVVLAERSVSVRSHGMELQPDGRGQVVRERLTLQLLPEEGAKPSHGAETSYSSSSSLGKSSGDMDGSGCRNFEVKVGLVGSHQHDNVAAAVATARVLRRQGWRLPDEAIQGGLREAQLPGRFQVVKLPGPDGPYVVLDGAHTAESATALADSLRTVFPGPTATAPGSDGGGRSGGGGGAVGYPVALVLAMADDKAHREVVGALRGIQPRVAVFTTVPIAGSYRRAAAPGTLAGHWQASAIQAPPSQRPFRCRELVQASLGAAFEKARQELRGVRAGLGLGQGEGSPGVILVTGSLHAVAEAHKLPELQPLLMVA